MLYAYLTVAPPIDIAPIIGGAIERIFKSLRGQIHHDTPHFGEIVLGKDALLTGRKEILSRETYKS